MRNNSKENYPLTKGLTDDQFNSITREQIILLQIEWTRQASVKKVTGTKKAFERNLPDPPPNYYACSTDIKKNIKRMAAWWKIESTKQMKVKCIEYDSLPYEKKLEYLKNIQSMMEQQMLVIGRMTDRADDEMDGVIARVEESSATNDLPMEGNKARSSSDASLSSSGRPSEYRRRSGRVDDFSNTRRQISAISQARSRSTVANPSNADGSAASNLSDSKVIVNGSEQHGRDQELLSKESSRKVDKSVSSRNEIGGTNHGPKEKRIRKTSHIASKRAIDNGAAIAKQLQHGQDQELLSKESRKVDKSVSSRNEIGGTIHGPKETSIRTTSHIASKLAIDNGMAIAKQLSRFVASTPCGEGMKRDCNDYFLVHYTNVKTAAKTGDNKLVQPLDRERIKVTFFCRSREHLLRMFQAAVEAMTQSEYPHVELAANYSVEHILGEEDQSLGDCLTSYRRRLRREDRMK